MGSFANTAKDSSSNPYSAAWHERRFQEFAFASPAHVSRILEHDPMQAKSGLGAPTGKRGRMVPESLLLLG